MSHSTSTASVLNTWEYISIWCINHDEPVEMAIYSNTERIKTPYYACPKNNDDSHCANRLNLDDYQGLVLKFLDMIAEDPFSDFTHRTFSYKGARQKIFVRVLKYEENDIRLGIKNTTVLG